MATTTALGLGTRGLGAAAKQAYSDAGHVTVDAVFEASEIDRVLADLQEWSAEFVSGLEGRERDWYLEAGGDAVLRKLDSPHFHRPVFRDLAAQSRLVDLVEDIIGPGVSVYFSQIFMKPPRVGGPKPLHQDNYYFGPRDPEGVVTAWIALDAATVENGCLHFADGTNKGPVLDHVAPEGEPFNLQIPADIAAGFAMTPAPVRRGGVSFHHGNTFHQSSDNTSDKPRRACAFHYVSNGNVFETPGLDYDHRMVTRITG